RAVAVGLVTQYLLHTALRLTDVQLGGDKEPGLPEAQHQHGHDHEESDGSGWAEQRDRTLLGGLLLVRRVLLGVLTVLPRLAVLAGLPGLAVLTGLAVLA